MSVFSFIEASVMEAPFYHRATRSIQMEGNYERARRQQKRAGYVLILALVALVMWFATPTRAVTLCDDARQAQVAGEQYTEHGFSALFMAFEAYTAEEKCRNVDGKPTVLELGKTLVGDCKLAIPTKMRVNDVEGWGLQISVCKRKVEI